MKLAVWGAGGHAGVVLETVRQQGLHEVAAFVVDDASASGATIRSGVPLLYGRRQILRLLADGVNGMVIAVGNEAKRRSLAAVAVDAGFELCTIIHPSSVIASDVRIGQGTVVFAGALVQPGCEIGGNVVINTGVSIDHDCRIGYCAQLAPRVVVGGGAQVGDLSFIGIGATVINRVVIGRNCLIGAGAVVVKDINDHSVAYGVPARVVRHQDPL